MEQTETELVCGWLLEPIVMINSKTLLHSYNGISWEPSEKWGLLWRCKDME